MSASLSHDVATSGPVRRNWARRLVQRNGWVLGIVGLLLALLGAERAVHPTLNAFDLQSLVDGALPLALAAMGQAAVVLSGGIDLSVGPMMSLVNVASALLMAHADLPAAVVIGLLLVVAAAVAGGLTGIAITATGMPDIVATLASGFVWAGLALHLMPIPGGGAPAAFAGLMTGQFGPGLPAGLVVILAALAVWLPVRRSRLGLAMYAVGSSRPAAYLSGVDVTQARIAAYVLGGVFTALGGALTLASLQFTSGVPVVPEPIHQIGSGTILGYVPLNLLVWAPLSLALMLGLRRSGFGRLIYAVGDNPLACRLSGVRVWQVLLGAYIISGVLSTIAGVLLVGYTNAADLNLATPYLLPSVAAVVIGGTSILGGRGGYGGTILGALILTVLDSLLTILNISQAGKQMLYGAIVLGLAWLHTRASERD